MRQIAEAVADITGTAPRSIPLQQARELMGPFAAMLASSSPLDPSRAERLLGWRTVEPALLDELRRGSYAAE